MTEWKAMSGRITLFPLLGNAVSNSALELFKTVWIADPDSYHKSENVLAPTVAQGKFNNAVVNCTIQPGRIDFNINPPPSSGDHPPLIEKIGTLRTNLEKVIAAIENFRFDAMRVALYVQVGRRCDSFEEGNAALADLMPSQLKVNAGALEDLIVQVNQRYESKVVHNHWMNFIKNWSFKRVQIVKFDIANIRQPSPTAMVPTVSEFLVPTFSIDANSVASTVVINATNVPVLTGGSQRLLVNEAMMKVFDYLQEIGIEDDN